MTFFEIVLGHETPEAEFDTETFGSFEERNLEICAMYIPKVGAVFRPHFGAIVLPLGERFLAVVAQHGEDLGVGH